MKKLPKVAGNDVVYPHGMPKPSFAERFASMFWTNLKPLRPFNLNALRKCGRYSYGELSVLSFGGDGEHLEIGEFTSIGPDTLFILGGEHRTDRVSTFPYEIFALGEPYDPRTNLTKGPIIVGSDVWIGARCTILSGVKIGQGSVVGAGSVVSDDIKPYTIVGGNPAKLIRQRFDSATTAKLMELDYFKLTPEKMKSIRPWMTKPMTFQTACRIVREVNA
jgi:acetyltransferase-like isoleucine patch superfamily enzyme